MQSYFLLMEISVPANALGRVAAAAFVHGPREYFSDHVSVGRPLVAGHRSPLFCLVPDWCCHKSRTFIRMNNHC